LHLPLLVLLADNIPLHREQEELDLVEILILVVAVDPRPSGPTAVVQVVHQLWVVVDLRLVVVLLEETMVVVVEVDPFLAVGEALERQEL
jgi:hypothetical protein